MELKLVESLMDAAIDNAKASLKMDDVPVGAVVYDLSSKSIVGQGKNERVKNNCAISHAEINAIKDASKTLDNWRLDNCILISTLEPCVMCAGAIQQSRIKEIYFGAYDHKAGACGSVISVHNDDNFYHRYEATGGIRSQECSKLLTDFFKGKRL